MVPFGVFPGGLEKRLATPSITCFLFIFYLNASRIPPGRFERIERIERFDWIEKAEGLKG